MKRRLVGRRLVGRHLGPLLVAALMAAVACGGPADDTGGPAGSPARDPAGSSAGDPDTVVVRFGEHTVRAELAVTPEEQRLGLMHRTELAPDAGMLFVFPETRRGGFWMKNTLIPLSIAFLGAEDEGADRAAGADGYRVLAVLDMEPCTEDPCPSYDPGLAYDAALEVNQSWFEGAGVEVGDLAQVEGLTTPQ